MFSVFSESKYTGIGIVQVMYSPLIEQLRHIDYYFVWFWFKNMMLELDFRSRKLLLGCRIRGGKIIICSLNLFNFYIITNAHSDFIW